jgi:hypothetical protein
MIVAKDDSTGQFDAHRIIIAQVSRSFHSLRARLGIWQRIGTVGRRLAAIYGRSGSRRNAPLLKRTAPGRPPLGRTLGVPIAAHLTRSTEPIGAAFRAKSILPA